MIGTKTISMSAYAPKKSFPGISGKQKLIISNKIPTNSLYIYGCLFIKLILTPLK